MSPASTHTINAWPRLQPLLHPATFQATFTDLSGSSMPKSLASFDDFVKYSGVQAAASIHAMQNRHRDKKEMLSASKHREKLRRESLAAARIDREAKVAERKL